MRIVFMGGKNIGCGCLRYLIKNKLNIISVIANPSDIVKNRWYESIVEISFKNNIPVYAPEKINSYENISLIKKFSPDIIFVVYYDQILKSEIINIPSKGCINIHMGLVEEYRGCFPTTWAILNNEKIVGVSIHYINEGIDSGDIIAQRKIDVTDIDTGKSLYDKCTKEGIQLFSEQCSSILSEKITRRKQIISNKTKYYKRNFPSQKIDFSKSGKEIFNHIRAHLFKGFPPPFFHIGNKKFVIKEENEVLIQKSTFKKIQIISPATPDSFRCGDYWVQKDLENEFIKRGYEIVDGTADIDLYLFGNYSFDNYMSAPRKFCWVYSHPDLTKKDDWTLFSKQFEHIFVLSNKFLSEINNSSLLFGASSKEFIPRKEEVKYDIIFVGNAAKYERVKTMKYLINLGKYRICLAGGGWEAKLGNLIKKVDYKGIYIDNNKFGEFFNQGILSFYTAREDMQREEFVAIRILDIFRSSECLCISDENLGLKDISINIPIYTNRENLSENIDWFLRHPEELKKIANKCREDIKKYTFIETVNEIEKWIKK